MTSRLRLPKAEVGGFYGYVVKRFSQKMFGEVLEPVEVMWHNRTVLTSMMGFGRESSVFTGLERDVMEYAEAMSETPPRVTDELSARLLGQFGAAALVELTAVVGFANMSTRCNTAMGIESQGFSEACSLPLARPSLRYATSA